MHKSSHEVAIDSIIQIVNAYTMHTHCPKDLKAMPWYSGSSVPSHLCSSEARAPAISAIGLWGDPGLLVLRAEVSVLPRKKFLLTFQPKETRVKAL